MLKKRKRKTDDIKNQARKKLIRIRTEPVGFFVHVKHRKKRNGFARKG